MRTIVPTDKLIEDLFKFEFQITLISVEPKQAPVSLLPVTALLYALVSFPGDALYVLGVNV